jgi:hypothetical protein
MNILKMRPLIEGMGTLNPNPQLTPTNEKQWTREEKSTALEAIGGYNQLGAQLRREHSLMELAYNLKEITKHAHGLAMHETEKGGDDSRFDKNVVTKNMQNLEKYADELTKFAKEANALQQRMEAAYEDIGHILSRYFEIKSLDEGTPIAVSKIGRK